MEKRDNGGAKGEWVEGNFEDVVESLDGFRGEPEDIARELQYVNE